MRKIIFISLFSILSTQSFSADMIFESSPVPPMPMLEHEEPFTWSGRYIGVDLGYGWNQPKEILLSPGLTPGIFASESEGMFGGAYLGFGRQARNLYFGLESDLQYSNLKSEYTDETGLTGEYGVSWLGSTRLRVGYSLENLLGQEFGNILPYATGGLAYGRFKASMDNGATTWEATRGDTGYAVGGGLDFGIANDTIGKIEYQYMDFRDRTFSTEDDVARLRFKAHTVRAGIAYKF